MGWLYFIGFFATLIWYVYITATKWDKIYTRRTYHDLDIDKRAGYLFWCASSLIWFISVPATIAWYLGTKRRQP